MQGGVCLKDAACAAGLSEECLERWENDGGLDVQVDVESLAALLGLDPEKSVAVAGGWAPQLVDLDQWKKLSLITTAEDFEVNSYLIWDPDTRNGAAFDTGWFADDIFLLAETEGLNIQYLFITHMHGDHVAALGEMRKRWPKMQLYSNNDGTPAKNRIKEDQPVPLGRLTISCRLTPGHSLDGVTYLVDGWGEGVPTVAVVGDTIFAGSMGKDFSTPELAQRKVREGVLALPPDTLICPGHGPLTTVSEELAHNPFF